jgi:predicted TIM-barrel enzyme
MNNKNILNNDQKKQVFEVAKKRSERDKLVNKGVEVPFGNTVITLTCLEWDASNDFEDAVVELAKRFNFLTASDVMKTGIDKLIETAVLILRKDLLILAGLATNGKVTLEYVKEVKAVKNDVITLVVKSIEVNYSYIKNLIALTKGSK